MADMRGDAGLPAWGPSVVPTHPITVIHLLTSRDHLLLAVSLSFLMRDQRRASRDRVDASGTAARGQL